MCNKKFTEKKGLPSNNALQFIIHTKDTNFGTNIFYFMLFSLNLEKNIFRFL